MWDVMTKFTLALFFKIHANISLHDNNNEGVPLLTVIMFIVQATWYLLLWLSMSAVENSYHRYILLIYFIPLGGVSMAVYL